MIENNVEAPGAYIWFDAEFTSLDLDEAELLQVAAVITDVRLKRLADTDRDVNLFVRCEDESKVSPWVRENLGGLLERCRAEDALSVDRVDIALCALIDDVLGPPAEQVADRPVLAGNSIHNDWYLVRRLLPGFAARLNYRFLDVTAIKLMWLNYYTGEEFDKERADLVKQYFPDATADLSACPHDAYYDVNASIAELGYYQSALSKT